MTLASLTRVQRMAYLGMWNATPKPRERHADWLAPFVLGLFVASMAWVLL